MFSFPSEHADRKQVETHAEKRRKWWITRRKRLLALGLGFRRRHVLFSLQRGNNKPKTRLRQRSGRLSLPTRALAEELQNIFGAKVCCF